MAIDGKGRPTVEQAKQKKYLNSWLNGIAAYEREFKPWESRTEKILKRYRDDRGEGAGSTQARFNILWSNVQTLVPATFSRLPQPDVSRRFRDNDPVGRVASLILERALDFEIQHYPDYKASLKQVVHDRFLGGRGTVWARYEPHIQAVKKGLPADGDQVTEDVETEETLEYECAPIDYVHWKDFGHSIARTWEEVTRVWRRVYLTREACIERFGEEAGKRIPLDSTPEDLKKTDSDNAGDNSRALVYEGWDKEKKQAVWLSKSLKEIIDTKDDPLGLEGFFPCPRPIYATLTNESLIPVPDFVQYQDQAKSLDTLSDRIDGLIKALQVKGVYDASVAELGRLFTEASSTDLIPVENWAAFAEKSGLAGALDLVDLSPIAMALKEAYTAFFELKAKIDELTGLADIIRGQSDPNETLGAQKMKGNYASLRLKANQDEVAQFATDCLRLKAQIMCAKFDPETLKQISAVQQLSPQDQQMIPQAMQLLLGARAEDPESDAPNPLRSFRIDIAADTLVQMDEEAEKRSRMEFIDGIGKFFQASAPLVQQDPNLVPLVGELLKFVVAGFKVGKTIEGVIDEAMEKAKQAAMQPRQPPPDPKMEAVKAKAAADQQQMQADVMLERQRLQMEQQIETQRQTNEMAIERQRNDMESARAQQQAMLDAALAKMEMIFKGRIEIRKAEIAADAVESAAQRTAATQGVLQ